MTYFLQRTALIALATSALGACSTYSQDEALRPNFPIRAPDAAAPQAPAPAPAAPAATAPPDQVIQLKPAAPVESRPLEPLAPAAPPPAQPAPPPPAAISAPRAPAAPTYRTVTTRSVTGKLVEVEGKPVSYTVKKGDNLQKIAGRLDTTVEQLKDDNRLKKSKIRPGQVLKGPRATAKAYVAGPGDTLFSIAKRFNVTVDALRELNELSRNAAIRTGQKIRLPEGYRDHGPLATTSRVQVSGGPAAAEPRAVEPAPAPEPARPSRPAEGTPAYRTVTTRSVTGKVVEIEGKAVRYTVKKHDNLEKIADRLNTTVEQLKQDNRLKKSTIRPGQVLKGPRSTAKAYVAGQGDTLAAIGKRFSLTAEALRRENGLSRRASIRGGQKIRLPAGYRDRGPITSTTRVEIEQPSLARETPPPSPPRPPAIAQPAEQAPPPATVAARPALPPAASGGPALAPTNGPATSDVRISELGRGRFVWPLQGAVVSDYGPKGAGQRNDGINIGAQPGEPVRAAANGDVVYAGDQVPGFGNLVLIKHADGWVTAYGHLSRVDVKMQQKVAQGQQIGQAGATGGVSEPQLHFEVRYAPSPLERARPVDPKLVLPR